MPFYQAESSKTKVPLNLKGSGLDTVFSNVKYFFSGKFRRVSFMNSQILLDVSNRTLGFVFWRDAKPLTWSLIGFQTESTSTEQHDRASELVWNPHLLWSFSLLIFVDNGAMRTRPMRNLSGWDSRSPRLFIHLHVLIWIRFHSHALSRFNFFFLPRYKHVGF